nr:undecaprenyl-phosphate glucose phosphotransferase [uncultured Prevotella sp.]
MKEVYRGSDLVRWLVIVADFIILNILFVIAVSWDNISVPHIFYHTHKITLFVLNFSLFIGEFLFSSIIHFRRVKFYQVLGRTFKLLLTTMVCFNLTMAYLLKSGYELIKFSFFFAVAFYIMLLISRFVELQILKILRAKGRNSKTVMFIGNDPAIIEMYTIMIEDPSAGYRVHGYYADTEIPNAPKNLTYLGNMEVLDQVMDNTINNTINGIPTNIEEVFCCLSHDYSDHIVRLMQYCDKNVIHFYYLPRQFGEYKLRLEPQYYLGKSVFTNHQEPLTRFGNRVAKRTFDIIVSSIVCLCLLPFLPIIALIIKIQSPGPIFFRQARTGLNGKTFQCLKFRSMHVNKDADLVQATEHDPRKFAFGNFMRKTNIDEFPQFINVLKGDMSIVGPRPHMLHHTEIYGSIIDKYMVRHFSKPGITGWAQVTGYRGETKELWQMEERIKRDIWYIENWSFWLDIRIIYLTAKSIIIPDKNAY